MTGIVTPVAAAAASEQPNFVARTVERIRDELTADNIAIAVCNPIFRGLLTSAAVAAKATDSLGGDAVACTIYGYLIGDFLGHFCHALFFKGLFEAFIAWMSLAVMYVVSTPDPRNPFALLGLQGVSVTVTAYTVNMWALVFVFAVHMVGPPLYGYLFQRSVAMLSAQGGKSARPGLFRRALWVLWKTVW
jgi:hypothetical protein